MVPREREEMILAIRDLGHYTNDIHPVHWVSGKAIAHRTYNRFHWRRFRSLKAMAENAAMHGFPNFLCRDYSLCTGDLFFVADSIADLRNPTPQTVKHYEAEVISNGDYVLPTIQFNKLHWTPADTAARIEAQEEVFKIMDEERKAIRAV
tara:strand:- start:636 stop:1085 length:450 start_codon:yes stop_codon:yes gene_type:complete